MSKRILTITRAADYLGVTLGMLQYRRRQALPPKITDGGYLIEDLDAFLRNHFDPVNPTPSLPIYESGIIRPPKLTAEGRVAARLRRQERNRRYKARLRSEKEAKKTQGIPENDNVE